MRLVKTHPVYCKHSWNLGNWPINTGTLAHQTKYGYLCPRCQTIWGVNNSSGIVKTIGQEPKIQIGICEVEIPVLDKEPGKNDC